jgi:hypothetical protein
MEIGGTGDAGSRGKHRHRDEGGGAGDVVVDR